MKLTKEQKEYGKSITEMMNEKLFKINEISPRENEKFLSKLADFIFSLTGNVNIAMRLKNIDI